MINTYSKRAEEARLNALLVRHMQLADTPLPGCASRYTSFETPDAYFEWLSRLNPEQRQLYEVSLFREYERLYGEQGLMPLLALHLALSRSSQYEDTYNSFVNFQEYVEWADAHHPDEWKVYQWQLKHDYEALSRLRDAAGSEVDKIRKRRREERGGELNGPNYSGP